MIRHVSDTHILSQNDKIELNMARERITFPTQNNYFGPTTGFQRTYCVYTLGIQTIFFSWCLKSPCLPQGGRVGIHIDTCITHTTNYPLWNHPLGDQSGRACVTLPLTRGTCFLPRCSLGLTIVRLGVHNHVTLLP